MPDLELLDRTFLGSTVLEWLFAAAALVLSFAVLRLIKGIARRRLRRLTRATETHWDDTLALAVNKTRTLFLLITAAFIGSFFLELAPRARFVVDSVFTIALLIQAGIWISVVAVSALERQRQRLLTENPAAATTMNALNFISRMIIWSVVVLMALDNLGFDVTTLVAGLGIGGVAIALSVQSVLGDLFASLSIILDKPFVIGDFLIIDDYLGSVEYVGLKTTRIRSLSGEQLVFSNSDLLQSRIRNYGRMFERRVVFTLGVVYETPRDKLKRIPGIIREAVEAQDRARFDRSHFSNYADYALEFETVFYVRSPEYNVYMDIQQAIFFAIHEAFEHEGIEFAYPTQKLFLARSQD